MHKKEQNLLENYPFAVNVHLRVQILANRTPNNARMRVCVRFEFWQNAAEELSVRMWVRARQKILSTHSLKIVFQILQD